MQLFHFHVFIVFHISTNVSADVQALIATCRATDAWGGLIGKLELISLTAANWPEDGDATNDDTEFKGF